jgi:hypothetical protein
MWRKRRSDGIWSGTDKTNALSYANTRLGSGVGHRFGGSAVGASGAAPLSSFRLLKVDFQAVGPSAKISGYPAALVAFMYATARHKGTAAYLYDSGLGERKREVEAEGRPISCYTAEHCRCGKERRSFLCSSRYITFLLKQPVHNFMLCIVLKNNRSSHYTKSPESPAGQHTSSAAYTVPLSSRDPRP